MDSKDKKIHPQPADNGDIKRVRVSPEGRVMIKKSDLKALKESLPKKTEIGGKTVFDNKADNKDYGKKVLSGDASDTSSDSGRIGEYLEEKVPSIEVPLAAEDITALKTYAVMLREKNKVMNLTNITDDEGIAVRHFVDSLTIVTYIKAEQEKNGNKALSVIDVGTGAGFPGIPLKIALKDIKLTLLDSLAKRIGFLDEVIAAIGLKNVKTVHSRAEDAGHDKNYRGKYDISVARAVAPLPVLCEYCLPFVRKGGAFIAMKGHLEEELEASETAISKLGGTIEKIEKFTLPGTDMERSVVIIRKKADTPSSYPRKAGTPSKNPIK